MTLAAFLAMFLQVLAVWGALSLLVAIGWMAVRGAQLWRAEDSAALPAESRFPPAPRPAGERHLRGYWTPDGKRLTTLAGAPQHTGWLGFTTAELLEARAKCRCRPAENDIQLVNNESTVTAVAYLLKKERTKFERTQLRLVARLN